MRLLTLACDSVSEQAASDTVMAKIMMAHLPVEVGNDSTRVVVRGSILSILRLFGINKSNVRQVGGMLCTEINRKKTLCVSTVSKNMNKKKSSGEQGDDASPGAVSTPVSPLAGLTFGVESSIKPLPAALPPTALWIYMNPDVPNDERLDLPNPPILLEKRRLTYEQVPDYNQRALDTPPHSEDEGESGSAASPVTDSEGAAIPLAPADLQRLLVASSERL